jgi:hypothetical protein
VSSSPTPRSGAAPTTTIRRTTCLNTPTGPSPGDVRLAASLTIHHRSGDREGQAEIIRDTAESNRASALLLSVLDLHRTFIVQTRTPAGVDYLGTYVQDIGNVKPTDDAAMDVHRACRILDGHGRNDFDSINDVIRAARGENRCTETLLALLDLYTVVLPELSSTAGSKWLDECVAASHTQEAKEGNE